jgi:hypothetical protein
MSLYRQAGSRSWTVILVAVVAGLVIGGLGGYLAGRASKSEPTLTEQVGELRAEAQPLQLATEQVRIEYRGTVEDGEVVSPTEYQAASSTAARAIATFDQLEPDLRALDPAGTDRLAHELDSLSALVERRAPQSAVDEQAVATARALAATPAAPS